MATTSPVSATEA